MAKRSCATLGDRVQIICGTYRGLCGVVVAVHLGRHFLVEVREHEYWVSIREFVKVN